MNQSNASAITRCLLVLILLCSRQALADDWPQWLGPARDSVWRESGIIDTFPEKGPPVRWRRKIGGGGGYAGPAVADGRVFVADRLIDTSQPIEKPEKADSWTRVVIPGEDHRYYLFYSRWPREIGFLAWLTHSEIAVATSNSPTGPWEYACTALQGRRGRHWDAITAHNPKIKRFGNQYYLYYIGTSAELTESELIEAARGGYHHKHWSPLRSNQRTGVAVSSSLRGPWKRFDQPMVEPTPPLHTITVNPAITAMADGRFLLLMKGDKESVRSQRIQAVGIGSSPTGPCAI